MRHLARNLIPYPVRAEIHRSRRRIEDVFKRPKPSFKRVFDPERFPFLLFEHTSRLLRQVPDDLMPLQHNKVCNLELGCSRLDRLLLEPGDIFSFCRLVGRTKPRRGFVDGLEMHDGKLLGAPGGGLCQLANLVFWMALHVDGEILERHRHGLDLFPDDGRTVPFGMGATVFYNYRDLRFRNTLSQPLVLCVAVKPPLLWGGIYSDRPLPFAIEIIETSHRFIREADGSIWRENRVAKRKSFDDGRLPVEREIAYNRGRVCYEVDEHCLEKNNE